MSPAAKRRAQYWLFKSEPESRIQKGQEMKFSIDDLCACPKQTDHWDGVRNYQARNNMQSMRLGDKGFFYHSNCKVPGIVGIVTVVKEAYPDHTAFDHKDPHYDPKSDPDKPRWFMVDVQFERKLKRIITLKELKQSSAPELENMVLINQGRVSVQPVTETEFNHVLSLKDTA